MGERQFQNGIVTAQPVSELYAKRQTGPASLSCSLPEFENRRKREIAEKEKSRAKRAGKKQKRMHESKDLSKNRAINLIFLQKSVDKREDILYNYRST